MVDDAQDVAVVRGNFAPHAGEAARAHLEVRDAHDVVERHPERQEARRFARQGEIARGARVPFRLCGQDALQSCDVQVGVRPVLEVLHPVVAQAYELPCGGGKPFSRMRGRT